MSISPGVSEAPIRVERWHTELPLRLLLWLAAACMWLMIVLSIFGIVYGVVLGAVFFVAHVAFITHLRGSAVRLGPNQMPELYQRVQALSARIGMKKAPDAYVMQAGGSLNALATKFLGANFIVLYSELLEACGDNTDARDFIIAHELGHLHAGHLRLQWLLLPGSFVPFLGGAYSRACEYTSDRYGLAASDDKVKALDGLCILAAGGKHGPRVNRQALVAQRADVNTVWMKIGSWLSTHPTIAHRLAALDPSLAIVPVNGVKATLGAIALMASLVIVPTAGFAAFVGSEIWGQVREAMEAAEDEASRAPAVPEATGSPELDAAAEEGIRSLLAAVRSETDAGNPPPANGDALYELWRQLHPGEADPVDPYDGERFGYTAAEGEFYIWSAGPSVDTEDDDIYYASEGW